MGYTFNPITGKLDNTGSGGGGAAPTASFIKLQSSDTSTNVNATSFSPITWDSEIYHEGTDFSHDTVTNNSRITTNYTGYARVTFNIRLYAPGDREAPQFGIRANGTILFPDRASHTYIRAASGHNHSSANLSAIVAVSEGDYLEVGPVLRDGDAETVNLADQVTVTVEKL